MTTPPHAFGMWGLLVSSLDARDRALFARLVIGEAARPAHRRCWTALTHAGGTVASLAAVLLPLAFGSGAVAAAAREGFAVLAGSHLLVQLVKRLVGRPRPSRGLPIAALIAEPDRFSFPSGHAAAALSVALGYAGAFPVLGPLLLPAALLVGASRVVLGVHYPGDVLAGQSLALATAVVLRLLA